MDGLDENGTANAAGDSVAATGKTRALDIDRAKGFAIALVVYGHTGGLYGSALQMWYPYSVVGIYGFHMPFFMYLSGFVFFLVGAQNRLWSAPIDYIKGRFDRLMVPLIAFGVIVVVGKYLVSSLGPVDDDVTSIGDGLIRLITDAPGNPCVAIWYLVVLFVYSLVTPLLYRLGRNTLAIVLLVGCLGWIIDLPEQYYLHRIGAYYIFFGVGGLFAQHRAIILPILKRFYLLALVGLGLALYVTFEQPIMLLVCGLASIPAFHGLFLQKIWESDRLLLTIGQYSMAIYLLNTIAIGVAKLFYLSHLRYDGIGFPVMIAVLSVVGLVVPILVLKAMDAIPRLHPVSRYLQ